MPTQNTHTPPIARDHLLTHSHVSASTSGKQVAQVSDTVLVTTRQEQATPSDGYVLL